jgi:glycosyltransferase involved in cell wall biosynthesis
VKISVCIPNYNYERYLGRTIRSILDQNDPDVEILIADNASTDGSVQLVKNFNHPRIQVHVNACNIGFSGNLDRCARMASGDLMIMLSSDDLIRSGSLAIYRKFFEHLGNEAASSMVSGACDVIDPDDRDIGRMGPDDHLWQQADRREDLERLVGGTVYAVPGEELLRRSLKKMKNPFYFAATCYPSDLYRAIEGYGGGRLYNPDKWFNWRMLPKVRTAYFIDMGLVAYRWHSNNQISQQNAAGSLKNLVDEYVSTLELDSEVLERIGLPRDEVVNAFVEHDIARHALATLAKGGRERAVRILRFGRAAYPQHVRRNRTAWALRALLALGPIGQKIARAGYRPSWEANKRSGE